MVLNHLRAGYCRTGIQTSIILPTHTACVYNTNRVYSHNTIDIIIVMVIIHNTKNFANNNIIIIIYHHGMIIITNY